MAEQATFKEKYPHISQGMREMMLGIGATPQQLDASDEKAKANIDSTLIRYLTDIPKVCAVLVGEDGPGKDFIARALRGCYSEEPADITQPVIINGLEMIVVNTPGSWQMKVPQDQSEMMAFFVFVIDSKSQPTMPAKLNQFEVEKVEEAIGLGWFVVVDDHLNPGAKEYLEEDHPLYPFLKSDNVVHFDVRSDQTLGSTQQDIICRMLLNEAMSHQSGPKHPTPPSMQREENKGAAEEELCPSGDAPKADDDAIRTTSSDESGGIAMTTVECEDSWEMVSKPELVAEGPSLMSGASEMEKESGEAQKELLITKLVDATSSARIGTVVIGATGSGKSATANTVLGENEEGQFLEGSSAVSVTTEIAEKSAMVNGVRLTVVDTPGSWQTNHTTKEGEFKIVYVFVINLASPRFDLETLTKLGNVQDTEGNYIVKSGNFVVALSHADSALQTTTLEEYLEEIKGDPLHTFLTGDAKGKVIALNNAAETEYQRNAHRQVLLSRILLASSRIGTLPSKSWLSWSWGTLMGSPYYVSSTVRSVINSMICRSRTMQGIQEDGMLNTLSLYKKTKIPLSELNLLNKNHKDNK